MTPERAREIQNTRIESGRLKGFRVLGVGDINKHLQHGEREAVNTVWATMPGHTCWADALNRIAKDATT